VRFVPSWLKISRLPIRALIRVIPWSKIRLPRFTSLQNLIS
jgi:hypothetical protein